MTEPLDLARFRELADAYGGSVARWPAPYRQAAAPVAATAEGAAILTHAALLDERLDAWRVALPSDALSARVLADAPRRSRLDRARLWWSGAGIAAALAGAAAGTAAVAAVGSVDRVAESGTSFGDLPGAGDDR